MAAGILLVDKPDGVTSHDVVARTRRALNTRKVGHAGTLDPMATGLLVLGVDAATRLLTYLVGLDKTYEATIRLGVRTDSDDADGEIVQTTDASGIAATQIATGVAALTGRIAQVPSTVSAIKVGGRRAYDLARAGEQVELTPREVTVSRFEVIGSECSGSVLDLEVVVDCSSGTYIRALARDLGAGLGVGGHLTALRRTHVGPFDVSAASGVDAIDATALLSPAAVASAVLGRVDVTADEARDLRHGRRLAAAAVRLDGRPRSAAIDPEGRLVGVVERRGADLKSAMNMSEAAP